MLRVATPMTGIDPLIEMSPGSAEILSPIHSVGPFRSTINTGVRAVPLSAESVRAPRTADVRKFRRSGRRRKTIL